MNNYKEQRKKYYLTLDDIANYCNTTKQNISQFENGLHKSETVENAYKHLEDIFSNKYLSCIEEKNNI